MATERPAKVFGIGLSKTGTASLATALGQLGYRSLHWPHDQVTQRELTAYLSGASEFAFTIAKEYNAITDTPVASVYRELSKEYPNSRFILTVRDEAAWLESCEAFWSEPANFGPVDSDYREYAYAICRHLYGRVDFHRRDFRLAYRKHLQRVGQWFQSSPERLLVINICGGEGWHQICQFLDKPVPSNSFPRENAKLILS